MPLSSGFITAPPNYTDASTLGPFQVAKSVTITIDTQGPVTVQLAQMDKTGQPQWGPEITLPAGLFTGWRNLNGLRFKRVNATNVPVVEVIGYLDTDPDPLLALPFSNALLPSGAIRAAQTVTLFTAPGANQVYNIPPGAKWLYIILFGAGGGGGGGAAVLATTAGSGGAGGGGGARMEEMFSADLWTSIGQTTILVTVGAGGNGGPSNTNGSDGGFSQLGIPGGITPGTFRAGGGGGGNKGVGGASSPGGAGGATTSAVLTAGGIPTVGLVDAIGIQCPGGNNGALDGHNAENGGAQGGGGRNDSNPGQNGGSSYRGGCGGGAGGGHTASGAPGNGGNSGGPLSYVAGSVNTGGPGGTPDGIVGSVGQGLAIGTIAGQGGGGGGAGTTGTGGNGGPGGTPASGGGGAGVGQVAGGTGGKGGDGRVIIITG